MSRGLVYEEPIMNSKTVASSDVASSESDHGYARIEENTTSSDVSSSVSDHGYARIEANTTSESDLLEISGSEPEPNKESGDLFRSDEFETSASDTNSEASGADSSFENSVEYVFEDEEEDESGDESESNSNEDQSMDDSTKAPLSPEPDLETDNESSVREKTVEDVFAREIEHGGTGNEVKSFENSKRGAVANKSQTKSSKVDSDAFSLRKKSVEDVAENESDHDGAENASNSFGSPEKSTFVTKSSTKALKVDSDASSLSKESVEDVSETEGDHDGAEIASATVSSKSPQPPTEALKALRISDSPNSSAKKNTPRQSRYRARTINNIFDSPYNTRLKARMIRERDIRSHSEGGSTEE